ncbi:MAG: hypothetical protein P8J86_00220 [Phycisphaerales bacterium]|nr:hypothetical protein [Phycisphaerales bacterium]
MSTYRFVVISLLLSLSLRVVGCDGPKDNSDSSTVAGLNISELPLSVVSVEGSWNEVDPLFDDHYQWRCSAGVLSASETRLVLVTSSTCLGLAALVDSDRSSPDLGQYNLKATFAGHQSINVTQIGEIRRDLGISLLAIDNPMLSQGEAYMTLKRGVEAPIEIGADVVSLMQRGEVNGSYVFGQVTGLQEITEHMDAVPCIETDFKLQPQDRGSPLFLVVENRYVWVGVNTPVGIDDEELAFAVDANEIDPSQFEWFNADRIGVVELLASIYGVEAHVE